MTEVKLLTEAEWRELLSLHPLATKEIDAIRERGLIAPEPVDPLLEEAMLVAEGVLGRQCFEDDPSTEIAFAALRRGMELQRDAAASLTRERVEAALNADGWIYTQGPLDRLHAALTGAQ